MSTVLIIQCKQIVGLICKIMQAPNIAQSHMPLPPAFVLKLGVGMGVQIMDVLRDMDRALTLSLAACLSQQLLILLGRSLL